MHVRSPLAGEIFAAVWSDIRIQRYISSLVSCSPSLPWCPTLPPRSIHTRRRLGPLSPALWLQLKGKCSSGEVHYLHLKVCRSTSQPQRQGFPPFAKRPSKWNSLFGLLLLRLWNNMLLNNALIFIAFYTLRVFCDVLAVKSHGFLLPGCWFLAILWVICTHCPFSSLCIENTKYSPQ